MIVRNEEEQLGRCLASVRDVVDEIVVVDTGSTDRTRDVARDHGAVVLAERWENDFAGPRNTSLAAATGDWVLVLDADEEVIHADRLRSLLDDESAEGYFLREKSFIGQEIGPDAIVKPILRLFRRRPEFRYHGALHEQITLPGLAEPGACLRPCDVEIRHYGYLARHVDAKEKSRRNLAIVLAELEGGRRDPFTLFNAGVEFQLVDDHEAALRYFREARRALPSLDVPFGPLLLLYCAGSLHALERPAEALCVLDEGIAAFPDFPDLHYLQGRVQTAVRAFDRAALAYERAIALGDHRGDRYLSRSGTGTFYAWYALGELYADAGDDRAAHAFKMAATSYAAAMPSPV